jgi:hypothetical protein
MVGACQSPSPVGFDAAMADAGSEADAAPVVDVASDVPLDTTPPRDVVTASDVPDVLDVPDVRDAPDVPDVRDAADAPDVLDAPDAPDAPDVTTAPDVPGSTDAASACVVQVSSADALAGQVGGNGGSPAMDIACPEGQAIIGVAARVSDGPTAAGSRRSITGLSAVCAAVRFEGGAPVVGTETLVEVQGSGAFGWTPATVTAPARCPPGWVVSGLQASRGTNGELFIDVTVTCAELRADGMEYDNLAHVVELKGRQRATFVPRARGAAP